MLKIQVEYHPNPNCNTFHTSIRFTDNKYIGNGITGRREEMTTFLKKLMLIPGVVEVHEHNYEFRIIKASVFGWHEIIPKAMEAFKECHGRNKELERLEDLGKNQSHYKPVYI